MWNWNQCPKADLPLMPLEAKKDQGFGQELGLGEVR
jgi:hypothetical protein